MRLMQRGIRRRLTILGVLVAVVGFVMAGPSWMARFGALIVVAGLYAGTYWLLPSTEKASSSPRKRRKLEIIVRISFCVSALLSGSVMFVVGQTTPEPSPAIPSPTELGKAVSASVREFPVDKYYAASGAMGDIGDVEIGIGRFTYKTAGKGPHEFEWKYEKDGRTESDRPAKFGGVVWLSPPGAFGTDPDGGYDLRGFGGIKWEARAIGDPVNVEFFIGGIDRVWKEGEDGIWEFVRAPYPDTMPLTRLGIRKLTNEWQTFRESFEDQPESNFGRVVGGFGWIANWGNNGVEPDESGMGSNKVKKFTFEVRNVFYVKEIE